MTIPPRVTGIDDAGFLAAILRSSSDSITSETPDGTIVTWNPGAERLFGWSTAGAVGGTVGRFVPEDRAAELHEIMARLRQGSEVEEVETIRLHKDGTRIDVQITISAIRGDSDLITGFSQITRDIRIRKQTEEALLLRDRAIKASRVALIVTNAGQSNNTIAYASPEFELITGYRAEDVLGRDCRLLYGPATDQEAVALVRQRLDYSESCQIELLIYRKDGTPFWNNLSASPVHDDSGRLIQYVGVFQDVSKQRRLDEPHPQSSKTEAAELIAGAVAHDFNNLLTVINVCCGNLLTNISAGDPAFSMLNEIRAAGERAARMTNRLLLQSRVQEFSTQHHNQNLSNVRGIVERPREHSNADSESGIQRHTGVIQAGNTTIPPTTRPKNVLPKGNETVLLVEDEPRISSLVQLVLTECGYEVLTTTQGVEAIELAATFTKPIHLLLTDVEIPGGGGRIVAERIREAYPQVKVLFMSGHSANSRVLQEVLERAPNFLQKPFSRYELASQVRATLDTPPA